MEGVAMESRLFRIHPSVRDTPFIDACAAFLTPKMDLSQVMPSGCNLRCVAHPPEKQLAVPERPSASDYQEEENTIDPEDMHMATTAPVFQPYRGATGRAWMTQEYGLAVDTSSLLSSGTERDETDDEICSFKVMPQKPSLLDMMRTDMEENETVPPQSPERALTPTIGFAYDYTMDEPPDIQRISETPRHSTPHPGPPTLSAPPRSASQPPRPRASSVPPTPNQRSAWLYVTNR